MSSPNEPTPPEESTPKPTNVKVSAIQPPKQPKMQQKIALRFALGLFGVAALLFGWYFLHNYLTDPDAGFVDTTGWIAAIKRTQSGQEAVAIKPDGTVLESGSDSSKAEDRDIVFRPDGGRLFFTSNRAVKTPGFHIYRWNFASNNVDQRIAGTRTQEHPTFQVDGTLPDPLTMLVISSGVVVEFNPKDSTSHQLVPPEGKTPTQSQGDEGGGGSFGNQFGPEYEHLGTSFREAHWAGNRRYIVGVMRRDEGETLVVKCMDPQQNGVPIDDGFPHGVVAGDHIDMAVDPKTGNVVYTVDNFQLIDPTNAPKEMVQGNKFIKPYRNAIGILDLTNFKASGPLIVSKMNTQVFAQPEVAPDGGRIVFIGGTEANGPFVGQALLVCPFKAGAGSSVTPLVTGEVSSPCWSPDGNQIAFSIVNGNVSDIATVSSTGGTPKILTAGKGSFTSPIFSPAMSKASP